MKFGLLTIVFALLLAASCGGGGSDPVPTGRIAGSLNVVGPVNSAVVLRAGLFDSTGDTLFESAEVGRITSVAAATLNGRTVTYDFTQLEFGTYRVGLYTEQGIERTLYYGGPEITLSEINPSETGLTDQANFTGAFPENWGTISGVVQVSGAWPTDRIVFVGLSPVATPQAVLQHTVTEDDVNEGRIHFNLEGIAPGTWLVGLYGYEPQTNDVDIYGLEDDPITITAEEKFITNQNFVADFGGDPGTDPAGATISGVVTFNGALPAGLFYYVAANTIPPQQGAPPSVYEIDPAEIVNDEISYSLPFLPDDVYSVSVFSYDITTHQATYFGEHEFSILVANGESFSDIDFSADVTLLD